MRQQTPLVLCVVDTALHRGAGLLCPGYSGVSRPSPSETRARHALRARSNKPLLLQAWRRPRLFQQKQVGAVQALQTCSQASPDRLVSALQWLPPLLPEKSSASHFAVFLARECRVVQKLFRARDTAVRFRTSVPHTVLASKAQEGSLLALQAALRVRGGCGRSLTPRPAPLCQTERM